MSKGTTEDDIFPNKVGSETKVKFEGLSDANKKSIALQAWGKDTINNLTVVDWNTLCEHKKQAIKQAITDLGL